MQNQYHVIVPTSKLKQLVLIVKGVHVQQTMEIILPINIIITTRLPIYGNGVPIQQPKRANSYPQPSGELHRGSHNGRSPGGGLRDQAPLEGLPPYPHGGLPLDSHVGFYGW
jgi:hypothetical protein